MNYVVRALFKFFVFIIVILALFQLFTGHSEHIKRVQQGLNKPVYYFHSPTRSLYCDGKLIGKGAIKYEDGVQTSRSASNSNGIWRVNGSVYKQVEGSICEVRE